MSEFAELFRLIFAFLVVGGALAGATWGLWVAGVQGWAFYRERMALAEIVEARAATARADVALVRPDANGLLPLHRRAIEASTDAIITLMAQRIDALRLPANVPATIHYAPHIRQVEAPPVPQLEAPQATVEPRDLWQLWHAGALPAGGFLLGHNLETGDPVVAGWMQLYSALVGGTSGSGKSTLIRNVLVQSALQGGRFVVLDRHYGAGEESLGASLQPLRGLMMCDVAANERQMVDALRYVLDVGRRRLAGAGDRTPLILVVDETTALFQRSDVAGELATVLGEISQETRKVGVYALCIGQNFSGSIMKTEVRNSFASFFSCRTRRDVARVMSGDNRFAQAAEGLRVGQAVWLNTGGDVVRLAVPNCTQHHVERVARQCSHESNEVGQNLLSTLENRLENSPENSPADTPVFEPVFQPDDPRHRRIVEAFGAGRTLREIATEVYGVSGGSNYNAALSEIQTVLREQMRRLQGGANGR